MSSNCDLYKEKFYHKFLDVASTEKLKLVIKCFNWENNENDPLEKKWNLEVWRIYLKS